MIQILYESSLVILDRTFITLSTHEKSSYMVHKTFICLITCRQIAQRIYWNKKIRRKEYERHPLGEKGYCIIGIGQSIALQKLPFW